MIIIMLPTMQIYLDKYLLNYYLFKSNSFYVFRTDLGYLEGSYTYSKVSEELYDYEVYLTVQCAYDTNIENDTDGVIYGDEIELPFTNFTIYVTFDS